MYKDYFDSVNDYFLDKDWTYATCPICNREFLNMKPIVKCTCGITVNNRQPTQEVLDMFYETAPAMNKWAEIKDSVKEELRQGEKFIHVWKYIGDNEYKKILDVGCGNGFFLNHMRLGGVDRVGIEPSATAREHCNFPTYHSKEEFDGSLHSALCFDMITFFGVLEHVKRPLELVHSYKGYLSPHGSMGIIVPNVSSLVVQALGEEAATFCPQHLWYFNIRTLSKLMLMAGMELERWTTIEPETQPILKKLKGFKPYEDIGIKLTDEDINDMSILSNNKGYKIIAFFKRRENV